MLHVALLPDQFFAAEVYAMTEPDPGASQGREAPVPEPIAWTVSDDQIIRIDQAEGTSTTVYALREGTAVLAVKAGNGELKDAATFTVNPRKIASIHIREWRDPNQDPTPAP